MEKCGTFFSCGGFQQLQLTFEGCALSNLVPLFVVSVGSESRLSDILSQMMSTRRSNTA